MTRNPQDPAQFLAGLMESGQAMMQQFTQAGAMPNAPNDLMKQFSDASKQLSQFQQDYMKQMSDLWSGAWSLPGAKPAAGAPEDRRFAGDAWQNDPRFDLLRRTYLSYADFLQRSVELAPVDEKSKGQLRYATRQFADAMSPSNFFASNPEALQLAAETGGQSVIDGMRLYFEDLAKGRVSMTDESAFEVGRNIATTEGGVVFENELIQVIQYAPRTEKVHRRPLVVVPPCINKFYILDLAPENSFVRYAVDQGHTVFMTSWRNVDAEQGHLTWDDYLELGVMQAIEVAQDITGADRVNTLGFCVGGTLLASALGVMAQTGEASAASVTLLTTMLDFSDAGEIGLLVSGESVAAREEAIGSNGLLKGKELSFVFSSLRANDLIWQYVANSYLKGKAPPAFDLLYWNVDSTNLPGPMFCWYLRNTYLENRLREPDGTEQCGVPVDLSNIGVPAFIYASRDDHIVPWRTAFASTALLGPDATFVLGASGHIAGVINPPAKNKRNYWTGSDDSGDAERWLATAQSIPGSWWPKWGAWLAQYAGTLVPAPAKLGDRKYRVIEPAPGRYVKAKAE